MEEQIGSERNGNYAGIFTPKHLPQVSRNNVHLVLKR